MMEPTGDAADQHLHTQPSQCTWCRWLLIVVAACLIGFGMMLWWSLRPIQPVSLSSEEQSSLELKLDRLDGPRYVKGSKEIILTEREVNGLLNQSTQWGDRLKLEFGRDAIHARVETDLDPELPILGGKRLKMRARFVIVDVQGHKQLMLDDVTLWGVSLPNEWLGGIKGKDLLGELLGANDARMAGVEEFLLEPGQLRIRLAD